MCVCVRMSCIILYNFDEFSFNKMTLTEIYIYIWFTSETQNRMEINL